MCKRLKIFLPVLLILILAAVFIVRAEDEDIIDNSKELFKQVQLFADSLALISADYVEPVKVKDLIYGAIRGMTGTLDGYSQFLDPESFKEITEETKGEFAGVGIQIGIREGILTVISPIDDTPAFKAGVKAGDLIVKIDDETTRDMTIDDAVERLRGKPGTKVTITVIRKGVDKMLSFEITRAVIKLKSIKEARILEDGISYIKLIEFQQRTPEDLKKAIKRLMGEGAKSLVLDLRNNPGGLLDAAVDSADYFLEPGSLIVYTEGRDPEKRVEFISKRKSEFPDLDVVILVNRGSASASEIMAGAIKDNKRGLLVGVPTFGKGSVQTVIPLKDKSALRITTASYFTPSGKNLRDKGVDPDIYVKYYKEEKKKKGKKESQKKLKIFAELEKQEEEIKDIEKEKVKSKKEKVEGEEPDKEKIEKQDKWKYDSQLRAAVNILKGIKIFEERKTDDLSGEKPVDE